MTALIITADDFGLCESVNEAVEIAFLHGVLTTASLMTAGPAAADAVARAQRLPGLRVGLHLVLVQGKPIGSPSQVSALVGADGAFFDNLFAAGVRFFFHPTARRQLAVEIEAQFRAFAATGLPLDHVNAHNHMHLHPTVLGLILKIGPRFGMRAMRVPLEPPSAIRGLGAWAARFGLAPWIWLLRKRLARADIISNDYVLGLSDSGAATEEVVLRLFERLPKGVGEFYCHPATRVCETLARTTKGDDHTGELAALTSARVRALLQAQNARRLSFLDLLA